LIGNAVTWDLLFVLYLAVLCPRALEAAILPEEDVRIRPDEGFRERCGACGLGPPYDLAVLHDEIDAA
jgi:hypothetical protein